MSVFEKLCLFQTSIYSGLLNLDTADIERHCYSIRAEDEGRKVSNYGGWQSNSLYGDDPYFNECGFVQKILEGSAMYARNVMGLDFNEVKISNFWININNRGDCNITHTHPGLQVSGVYYVKIPENNSGAIRFIRPNHEIIARDVPEHLIQEYNLENSGHFCVYPEVNLMMLFPGWLPHAVEGTNEDTDRISISFNVNAI